MSDQTEPQLLTSHPYLLVDDVFKSAEYYRDVLGFHFDQFWGEPPAFVMVIRDGIVIMMRQPAEPRDSVSRPNRTKVKHSLDAYFKVRDVDALFTEFKAKGASILGEPYDQPHDCREFEVKDLNGYILCFGQDLIA